MLPTPEPDQRIKRSHDERLMRNRCVQICLFGPLMCLAMSEAPATEENALSSRGPPRLLLPEISPTDQRVRPPEAPELHSITSCVAPESSTDAKELLSVQRCKFQRVVTQEQLKRAPLAQ